MTTQSDLENKSTFLPERLDTRASLHELLSRRWSPRAFSEKQIESLMEGNRRCVQNVPMLVLFLIPVTFKMHAFWKIFSGNSKAQSHFLNEVVLRPQNSLWIRASRNPYVVSAYLSSFH